MIIDLSIALRKQEANELKISQEFCEMHTQLRNRSSNPSGYLRFYGKKEQFAYGVLSNSLIASHRENNHHWLLRKIVTYVEKNPNTNLSFFEIAEQLVEDKAKEARELKSRYRINGNTWLISTQNTILNQLESLVPDFMKYIEDLMELSHTQGLEQPLQEEDDFLTDLKECRSGTAFGVEF